MNLRCWMHPGHVLTTLLLRKLARSVLIRSDARETQVSVKETGDGQY